MRRFTNDYNADGKQKRLEARASVGFKCIRCGSPSVPGKILTTHHFDGNKANDAWWNLLPLCQSCHLHIQGKVDPETPWFLPHSEWLKPYVAGFYASKYEGKNLTRTEVMDRLEELLAHELRCPDSQSKRKGKPYADMDYEERMAAWGARFTGASQDSGHRNPTSRSTDDGIKDQT